MIVIKLAMVCSCYPFGQFWSFLNTFFLYGKKNTDFWCKTNVCQLLNSSVHNSKLTNGTMSGNRCIISAIHSQAYILSIRTGVWRFTWLCKQIATVSLVCISLRSKNVHRLYQMCMISCKYYSIRINEPQKSCSFVTNCKSYSAKHSMWCAALAIAFAKLLTNVHTYQMSFVRHWPYFP